MKIDPAAGTWKDFEQDEGGGVLDLVERERSTDKAKTRIGKFCGFSESGPALSAGEVEDLKAAWRNQVNNQTRKRKKPNKTSGKDQASEERNPY